MAGVSHLSFDCTANDFLVNGRPLLAHLGAHEGIVPASYQPSLGCEASARARLLGRAAPDLGQDHVSLYLCGMCGGYDGSPIGTRLVIESEFVRREDLGWYDDFNDDWHPFQKVRAYRFDRSAYVTALHVAV